MSHFEHSVDAILSFIALCASKPLFISSLTSAMLFPWKGKTGVWTFLYCIDVIFDDFSIRILVLLCGRVSFAGR